MHRTTISYYAPVRDGHRESTSYYVECSCGFLSPPLYDLGEARHEEDLHHA